MVRALSTRRVFLLTGLAAGLAPARAAAQGADRKIKAVATISILGDLVRNVGGDRVDVATLVGPNGDAHVFSPTPTDAKTVATAAIIVVNGLGLEGWMTRLIQASGSKAPTVVATKGITPRRMSNQDLADEGKAARRKIDPHAWQSVANAKIYVANIRDGLDAVDPAGKATYDANAAAYLAKLDDLDAEVRAAIAQIPPARRKVITTHDAFGYFGDAYGVAFIAPEGVSTEAEPSARDVANIIAQIRQQNIPAVFLENVANPRLMDQIAHETGATIGGTLYSDALSAPGGAAPTYIDMMRHNVQALTKALAG
jgi:zinc/manganese transport system substrate-binding protein